MLNEKLDDKELVILCATIIALFALFGMDEPAATVNSVVSGRVGVATGFVCAACGGATCFLTLQHKRKEEILT